MGDVVGDGDGFIVELLFVVPFVVVVVACVVDEELVTVEGDDVGAVVDIEPCPAELDDDDVVVL